MREPTLNAKGYQQITNLSSAVGLTVPGTGALHGRIAILIAEGQTIRWRDDGTNPTATVGMPLEVGQPFVYTGDLGAIKVIETAASAKLNVSYYA